MKLFVQIVLSKNSCLWYPSCPDEEIPTMIEKDQCSQSSGQQEGLLSFYKTDGDYMFCIYIGGRNRISEYVYIYFGV